MVLALCTGCPHAYPQFYGLVVIIHLIGHSLCYPMGYDLPSPSLAQSLHPAYAMPPPGHRRTLPPYLVWVESRKHAVETKGSHLGDTTYGQKGLVMVPYMVWGVVITCQRLLRQYREDHYAPSAWLAWLLCQRRARVVKFTSKSTARGVGAYVASYMGLYLL